MLLLLVAVYVLAIWITTRVGHDYIPMHVGGGYGLQDGLGLNTEVARVRKAVAREALNTKMALKDNMNLRQRIGVWQGKTSASSAKEATSVFDPSWTYVSAASKRSAQEAEESYSNPLLADSPEGHGSSGWRTRAGGRQSDEAALRSIASVSTTAADGSQGSESDAGGYVVGEKRGYQADVILSGQGTLGSVEEGGMGTWMTGLRRTSLHAPVCPVYAGQSIGGPEDGPQTAGDPLTSDSFTAGANRYDRAMLRSAATTPEQATFLSKIFPVRVQASAPPDVCSEGVDPTPSVMSGRTGGAADFHLYEANGYFRHSTRNAGEKFLWSMQVSNGRAIDSYATEQAGLMRAKEVANAQKNSALGLGSSLGFGSTGGGASALAGMGVGAPSPGAAAAAAAGLSPISTLNLGSLQSSVSSPGGGGSPQTASSSSARLQSDDSSAQTSPIAAVRFNAGEYYEYEQLESSTLSSAATAPGMGAGSFARMGGPNGLVSS